MPHADIVHNRACHDSAPHLSCLVMRPTFFRRGSFIRLEQSTKGRLSPAQPRIGEHHRLGLAHRVGNQSLSVKTFHRVPVERLPRTRAHHGFTFEDAQIEERQHGFIDLVVDPFPTHREQGSPASSGASRGAESRPTLLRRDAPLSIAQPRAAGNLDDAWSQTGSTSVDLTGADTATRGFATRVTPGDPEFDADRGGVGGRWPAMPCRLPHRHRATASVEPYRNGDLRLVDGGDSAEGRLERRYDDRAWT